MPKHDSRLATALRATVAAALLGLGLLPAACGQGGQGANAAPPAASGPGRRVEIQVNGMEFTPSKIDARAGERLDLVFTRPAGPSCVTKVIFTDGPTKDLPENTPVTFSVTAPASGTLDFACPYQHARGQVRVQ